MSVVPATITPSARGFLPASANAFLLVMWAVAAGPALSWSLRAFGREDQRLQLVLAVILGAWALPRVRWNELAGALSSPPTIRLAPILWVALFACGLGLGRRVEADLVVASCAGMGLWAMSGLWLDPAAWRRAAVPAALLVALLPLATALDVMIGFPARQLTATIVADLLTMAGAPAASADAVMSVDGSSVAVDIPCAGMRSLWAGAVLWLGALLIERRPVDLRAGAIGLGLAGMLFAANTVRVLILTVLALVVEAPALADAVHVPLGLTGFAVSAGLAVWALQTPAAGAGPARTPAPRGLWPALALGALWLLAAGVPPVPPPPPIAPVEWAGEPLALTPAEVDYYDRLGVDEVRAWRFSDRGLAGRVITVPSADWRAHHLPEQCLRAAGLDLGESAPARIGELPVRIARAGTEARPTGLAGGDAGPTGMAGPTAIWWLQSADGATDDHARRVWEGLFGPPQPWVLVSVLVDGPADLSDPRLQALTGDLRAAVASSLEQP
jgi:exosortase/archaeosortase family protein